MTGFKSVELFTGAGGLALGLEKAGWHHVAMVELDKHACATLKTNKLRGHPLAADWEIHAADVRGFDYGAVNQKVDMVAGGPPCQPFSLGGKHQAYNDKRDMFGEAVRAVREMKPKFFVFENVKGLLRESFATYFNYVILQLTYPEISRRSCEGWKDHLGRLERFHTGGRESGLTYRVVYRLLNAAEYGVPQVRERVFIVGFQADLGREWCFPTATHSAEALLWDQWVTGQYWEEHGVPKRERPAAPPQLKKQIERLRSSFRFSAPAKERFRTVRDALSGLPSPQTDSGAVANHEYRNGAKRYPGHTGSPLDEPAKTIKAGNHGVPGGENMLALPDGNCRYYTVRESARIQTFPDDYLFCGSWTESMRQIGNAVPVSLAEAVGESIRAQNPLKLHVQ
ncbi:MAG: Modification methylase HaeIII [Candidatus Latescibacteria bacterium ADurb.Bin168]|nr:MAG: Modification methylase HaeIII [Candidatus Latescibacteria bacterium ADurb.Bin168]